MRLDHLLYHLRHHPDRIAFSLEGKDLTFGQLHTQSAYYAGALKAMGCQPGDRVACWLDTSLEMIIALLGHYRADAIHVPINTRYGKGELQHLLEDSGAKYIIVDHPSRIDVIESLNLPIEIISLHPTFEALCQHPEPLDQWPTHDEQIAMFIYTSGTTGPSKGVQLSFRAIIHGIKTLTDLWQFQPTDRMILALPLFHVHGLCIGIHGTLIQGCTTELHPHFDPVHIHEAITQRHGSIFMGVPTMYTRLVHTLDEHPEWGPMWQTARLFTSGSAALSAQLFERFEQHTTHRILERYGMSETLLTLSNPFPPSKRRPGTIGHAINGVDICILDDTLTPVEPGTIGQLAVRGPTLMSGYWNLPQKTADAFHDHWFLTGDAVRIDAQGYIVHVGRQSVDILKSGGYKISAREIEEALLTHPHILDVAIIGLPDEEWGQRIAAAIVTTDNAPSHTTTQWLTQCHDHLNDTLARFKHPRAIRLLNTLPRNALGKLQKHLIAPHFD